MSASFCTKRIAALEIIAAIGVAVFALVCASVQFLRTDLDWIATPLSNYLIGPFGSIVIAAYLALGAALVAIGCLYYRELVPQARSAAPLLLFAVAGIALGATALSEAAKTQGHPVEWEMVHLAAAETTFLCVTVAMILQSFWLRRDPRWQAAARFALPWSTVTFAALWIYALWRGLPRGLSQKTVIALIVIWLGWAAVRLWLHRPDDKA